MVLNTQLNSIAALEQQRLVEHQAFKAYIKSYNDDAKLDAVVQALEQHISPLIDCTQCGNCCRSLMINVTEAECTTVSQALGISEQSFTQQYVETSTYGAMVINTIPCHFLSNNKCTIYQHRFRECRDFPHLHQPNFSSRIGGTLMHYGRCPIIYNVIEQLKVKLSWQGSTHATTQL